MNRHQLFLALRAGPTARAFARILISWTAPPREEAAMRSLLITFLLLGSGATVRADTFVYVSMAPEQKIQVYRLDPVKGALTAVEAVPVKGTPGALAVDPRKRFLFA